MKNQAYRMALLYDFYGDMLTDRQKEFYDLYYNEDLSLAEIAENYGITRQRPGCDRPRRGHPHRAGGQDGHHPPLPQNAGAVRQMETAVDAIAQRNEAHWQDDELESLCGQLKGVLAQLKQE